MKILERSLTDYTRFVHLHQHTGFSLLDGYGSTMQRAIKAKELGMTAMALTDHNHLGGSIDFKKACDEQKIKPIYGVELYHTEDTSILSKDAKERTELAIAKAKEDGLEIPAKAKKKDIADILAPYEYDTKQYHILFLAKNQKGWGNLVKLQSEAARVCTYNGRFLCDDNMIEKYKEGLIMTTACLGSVVNNLFMKNKIEEAHAQLDKWREMFGRDFYIEIQPLNDFNQAKCNYHLIEYAQEHNVKLVATNDIHYTNKEDNDDHDTLMCIGTGKYKDDDKRMKYAHEFWMRSADEMREAFEQQFLSSPILQASMTLEEYVAITDTALYNTSLIAEKTDRGIELGSKETILPKLEIPHGFTSSQYLTLLAFQGLYAYLAKNPALNKREYLDRLSFELNVINTKGYADYMLIVRDVIQWCQENDIPVGPGRGSAAGSLVLFVTGITKCIDPIKYGLLFSRFLTMDRTALPDIDTDFSNLNRHKVIEYFKEKYGAECVSFIGTYTVLGVKNGLKDVGRVLNYDFGMMNTLTKKVSEWTDDAPGIKFKDLDALIDGNAREKAFHAEFKAYENQYPELFRIARAFEGTCRGYGVHASGVLCTPMPINDIFPTRTLDDGSLVTLYTGPQCEDLGSCKLDILGLKTLDVLDIAVKSLDKNKTVYDLYNEVDNYLDNKDMFDALCRKETEGIFQLESNLFKGLVSDMMPECLDDITLITSYGRPGPLSAKLPEVFARRKRGEEEATEPLPNTWDIVKDSLGVLAYQEHCMRIAQRVAGFDDNQADSFLRKALAKKKKVLLELCDQWFIYGKINEEAPEGYDYENKNQPYYDPTGKYGHPIKGGLANGYNEKDLKEYCVMIKDFASYLFNKSHAASYSFISVCTMYLKTFSTTEFFAALLSLQDKQEKIDLYCKIAKRYGIDIKAPNINISTDKFTPSNGTILYGLGSLKGVGEKALPHILENAPYTSLADAYERVGKKSFNKTIGESLIKAGAFDFLNKNRNVLLNEFQTIRKATKKEEAFDEFAYNEALTMEYEKSILGSSITFTPYWDEVQPGEKVKVRLELTDVNTRLDKRGNTMAFLKGTVKGCEVSGVVFSSIYCNNVAAFDKQLTNHVLVEIQKDDKEKFVVKKVLTSLPLEEVEKVNIPQSQVNAIIDNFDSLMEKASA